MDYGNVHFFSALYKIPYVVATPLPSPFLIRKGSHFSEILQIQ